MSETLPHYDVVFATPGRQFHVEYLRSMIDTLRWLGEQGKTFYFMSSYSSFVPSARELTALDAPVHDWKTRQIASGAFTYGKIFWIDSDISWNLEHFIKIYESDLDIISGLYQTSPAGIVAVHFPDKEGRPTKVNKVEFMLHDEPVEVGGVGFGFVAMKSGVFEKCDRPWFLINRVTWTDVEYPVNVGEDYSWCANAQRNGFKIYVDPTVKVRHHKETIYEV